MKPDFDTMSMADLRAYLLSHRNDDEAFFDTPTAKADGILGSPTRHNPAGLHQPS